MEGRRGRVPAAPVSRVTNARLRPVTPSDVDALVGLWKASIDGRYPLRADVLGLSLAADQATTMVDAALAEIDGRIVGFAFAGTCASGSLELAPLRGRVWLQAVVVAPEWRRRGFGSALVRRVVGLGRSTGATDVSAGGGLFYLWPGVPDSLSDAPPFLEALGFVFGADVGYDLRGDISGLWLDDQVGHALATAGCTVVPAAPGDRAGLVAFILAEFGPEWWHDIGFFLDAGGDPADLLLLVDTGGAIRGFARIHTTASRPPGWPMFLRGGAPDAGGLGPIGVAEALRGRGLGRALLVSALHRLRTLGATDVVIDDTTLLGYYGPHGFRPWIAYRHATAPIGSLLADRGAPLGEDA